MKELLEKRNHIKRKKPFFVRQKAFPFKRLDFNWRHPAGKHSKMRLGKRGHRLKVSPGWKSPVAVRFLSRNGLVQRIVCSVKDLDSINKKTDGIIISGGVGNKNRIDIIKKALEKGLAILNFKDPEKIVGSIEDSFNKRKSEKAKEKSKKKVELKRPKKEGKPCWQGRGRGEKSNRKERKGQALD